jgi:hypothetical protein
MLAIVWRVGHTKEKHMRVAVQQPIHRGLGATLKLNAQALRQAQKMAPPAPLGFTAGMVANAWPNGCIQRMDRHTKDVAQPPTTIDHGATQMGLAKMQRQQSSTMRPAQHGSIARVAANAWRNGRTQLMDRHTWGAARLLTMLDHGVTQMGHA